MYEWNFNTNKIEKYIFICKLQMVTVKYLIKLIWLMIVVKTEIYYLFYLN